MGLINKLEQMEKKLGEGAKRDKEKLRKLNNGEIEPQRKPTEQEKLHKAGNTIVKGVSFYLLIPVFAIFAIIATFAGFWIWDMITGLF